jgi:hypothetical protein
MTDPSRGGTDRQSRPMNQTDDGSWGERDIGPAIDPPLDHGRCNGRVDIGAATQPGLALVGNWLRFV